MHPCSLSFKKLVCEQLLRLQQDLHLPVFVTMILMLCFVATANFANMFLWKWWNESCQEWCCVLLHNLLCKHVCVTMIKQKLTIVLLCFVATNFTSLLQRRFAQKKKSTNHRNDAAMLTLLREKKSVCEQFFTFATRLAFSCLCDND